jgi:hypothetical protein
MQLGPGQHEPKLPRLQCAFDHLDLVDPDLGLAVASRAWKSGNP